MPNAWNAGSACLLQAAGFPAVGTTSAGIAFSLGLPDYEGLLSREAALEETERISRALRVPVSADAENGYGHMPDEVAECIRLFAGTGAVGASIEDYSSSYGGGLYDRHLAVDRIRAAAEAAASLAFPFTLTARAECYLVNHPEPFKESVTRANLYREAGADCLYVPGVRDAQTIGALVKEIDGPINVVLGLTGSSLTVSVLESLGVKRISIGGALMRATFGLVRRAAAEIQDQGTFTFADEQVPDEELCRFFSSRLSGKR
jgi:2-methylisocitrate lyase-like PEP mutase family enzyme